MTTCNITYSVIFSGTHRIKGGLINNRKSKHPRSESNDDHSRPNKRRKLSHNHNHNKSKEKDKDKNKGKKKDKKDKKKNNKKKNKKKEDNTETNNDDEDEYEDEEQEDPYGGLPYYFHLAAHCEPNLDTDPQRSTNIKQLLCANNTNRDSR